MTSEKFSGKCSWPSLLLCALELYQREQGMWESKENLVFMEVPPPGSRLGLTSFTLLKATAGTYGIYNFDEVLTYYIRGN